MSLTSDDFEEFVSSDPDDDETVPLGQALSELGLDVEVDSVEAVRDVRERLWCTPRHERSRRSSYSGYRSV